MRELESAYERLRSYTKKLEVVVNETNGGILTALSPSSELPPNCPSHASHAAFHLQDVQKVLHEVNAACEAVHHAIWQHP